MWYLVDIPGRGEYRVDLHSRVCEDCGIAYEVLPEGMMWKNLRDVAPQSQPIQEVSTHHSRAGEWLRHWHVDPLAGWRKRWV